MAGTTPRRAALTEQTLSRPRNDAPRRVCAPHPILSSPVTHRLPRGRPLDPSAGTHVLGAVEQGSHTRSQAPAMWPARLRTGPSFGFLFVRHVLS